MEIKLKIKFDAYASTGYTEYIEASDNITISDLLKMYAKKIYVDENFLRDEMVLLFNENRLDINSNEILKDKFSNNAIIIVLYKANIIMKSFEPINITFQATSG